MERYYVKRPTGKVFGPFDQNAIKMMLKGQKLGPDAHVSTDKEIWHPISEVAAFSDILGSSTRSGVPTAEPSMLPTPRATQQGGWGADLPGVQALDLPTPALGGGGLDLPGTRNLDLPGARGSDLPRPLEFGRDSDLPRLGSAAAGLPAPRSLPRSASTDDDDLFGSPIEDDDDLFAAPSLDEKSDDLFSAGPGIEEESDLFGAPSLDEPSDDLFAAPSAKAPRDEDPFGPAPSPALQEDSDDLFGAAPGIGGGEDDDDLFQSNAPPGGSDDFLGGDSGFSFLDDSPPSPADNKGWGDDLLGGDDGFGAPSSGTGAGSNDDAWGDDLLSGGDAPPPPLAPDLPPPPKPAPVAPVFAADDPFRPASTGLKKPEAATTSKAEAKAQDKKRGLAVLVGVPIVALAVLGGAGYAVYNAFFASEGPVVATTQAVAPKDVALDLQEARKDTHGALREFIDASAKGRLSPAQSGKALVGHALFLTRYEDAEVSKRAATLAGSLSEGSDDPHVQLGLGAYEASKGQIDATRAFIDPLLTQGEELAFWGNLFVGIGALKAATMDKAPAPAGEDGAEEQPGTLSEEDKGRFLERAEQSLRAAANLDAQAALPHYWLAQLAIVRDDLVGALESFERGINAQPDHVASRVAAGNHYHRRGDLNNASEHLGKVITDLAGQASTRERGEAHHLMGMVHAARQQSEESIKEFTQALSVDSTRSDTLRALANEYERARRYSDALTFFTTNKNLGQNDPDVMLGIVRSHMGLQQWAEAVARLEEGEKAFPEDARFPFFLGQLNLQRGTFFDARRAFDRAVEIDPTLLTAHAALAELAWRIDKDVPRGEEHIRSIVSQARLIDAPIAAQVADYYFMTGRRDLARQWNEEALRLNPNYWTARMSLARQLLEEGKESQALELLERARKEGIQDIRLSAYLADAYRLSRRFDQAIQEINNVIEQNPSNEEYIFIRGRIYFDRGNFETAREDFNKAYELNPRYHEAYFFVGRTALAQQDYATAKRIFRHVLDYQPNTGEYFFYMGLTFEEEENMTQALEQYRRATAVDQAYGLRNPEIFIRRGRILSRLGYTQEGKRDILRALELAPQMNEALIAMGEVDFRERNYKGVIENLTKALSRNPEHADAQYRLGMSYVYEGDRNLGVRHLQLALRHGYDNPDIYRTLGYLYREMGQSQQALTSFQTFIRETAGRNIPDATRREMLRQIKELGG
jgi:tetratricopeptide (TPR) repeat protein